MIRAIMHGCCGKMGHVITDLAAADGELEIIAGVDANPSATMPYPVYRTLDGCEEEADVIIDFSNAAAVDGLLDYAIRRQIPLVLCTTGLDAEQKERVYAAAKQVGVLYSANMSLGINLLLKLVQEAARVLAAAGFDTEIVERHHNLKLDAPSGTALALADSINHALDDSCSYTYDRSGERRKREKTEIGISSVRGGTIVGEHEVIFAGTDEVIEFNHRAYSKSIFAKGAVQAAKFLAGKPAGLYTMADVIG